MRMQYLTFWIAITIATVTVTPVATVRGQPALDNLANGFTVVPLLRGTLIPTASAQHLPTPSLSFSPPNITVAPGNSQNATVNIPNAASAAVSVNLNPANANVSI